MIPYLKRQSDSIRCRQRIKGDSRGRWTVETNRQATEFAKILDGSAKPLSAVPKRQESSPSAIRQNTLKAPPPAIYVAAVQPTSRALFFVSLNGNNHVRLRSPQLGRSLSYHLEGRFQTLGSRKGMFCVGDYGKTSIAVSAMCSRDDTSRHLVSGIISAYSLC